MPHTRINVRASCCNQNALFFRPASPAPSCANPGYPKLVWQVRWVCARLWWEGQVRLQSKSHNLARSLGGKATLRLCRQEQSGPKRSAAPDNDRPMPHMA